MNLVRKYDEIIRYIIAGILTTIVSIASYNLLRNINIDYKICTILSWILAVIFAYFINKLFVFKRQKNNIKEFINFILARLLSLFIEFIFMIIIVQFIVLVLNYVFSKFFVFKKI